jgi:lipopolysaccharide assembly protein A
MRWFHLAIIVLFVAATAIFALQNLQTVGVTFIRTSIQMPLAFLIVIIYLIGAATGGILLASLRRSFEGARRTSVP